MHSPFLMSDADVRHLGEGEPLQHDGFASSEEVAGWSPSMRAHDQAFTEAGTGADRGSDSRVRTDRTAWEADLQLDGMRDRFTELRAELNEAAWMGLALFSIQLAVYAEGGHYAAHRDALRGDPARRVTAILYLNSDWMPSDGGCLRVHTPHGHRDIEPRGGRLVLFRSDRLLHEVLPGHAIRQAATAWFRGRSCALL